MAEDNATWPMGEISEETAARLRNVRVQVSEEDFLDTVDLLMAWRAHVDKLRRDMDYPSSDRSVWGAYDLVAAYFIRDFLASAISILNIEDRVSIEHLVQEVDNRLLLDTEDDSAGLVVRLDQRSPDECGWWWHRIPVRGPVREEIISIVAG